MNIRIVAVAAVLASLASASVASAKTTPIPATAPAGSPQPGYGQTGSLAPVMTGKLVPVDAGVPLLTPPEESIEDDIRERQEQEARIMDLMRQMQDRLNDMLRRATDG